MTKEQCEAFIVAAEAADITAYQFTTDTPSHLYHNGTDHITKPIYDKECLVGFRSSHYGGSHGTYNNNLEIVMVDFVDVHEVRAGGSYEQIKKFAESFNVDLTEDELKVLLQIDKRNYDIKPITGDYASQFKYITSKRYDLLSDEEKAAYNAAKEEYEKKQHDYIGENQAASITL